VTCAARIATPANAFTEGEKMSLEEILLKSGDWPNRFKSSPSTFNLQLPLIELTARAIASKEFFALMKRLFDDGFTVLLETSGAHDISQVDTRVHRIMDLKCPGSGEVEHNHLENIKHLKPTTRSNSLSALSRITIGQTNDFRTQTRCHLPVIDFMGASACAGAAG